VRERADHADRVLTLGGNFGEAAARSQADVPLLLAAVEAVLKLAGEFNVEDGHYPDPGDPPVSRGDRIRETITAKLLGKET
jgi:hypothetical protein